MANISATFEAYIPLETLGGGKLVAHVGYATGDGTSNELATKLSEIKCAIITPAEFAAGVGGGGLNVYFCDRGIASGRVTIQRKADAAGDDEFNFILIGRVT